MHHYKHFKNTFTERFKGYCTDTIKRDMYDTDAVNILYKAALEYLLCDGKRLRPYLASVFYKDIDTINNDIWDVFYALELFHSFAIAHDDIIDKASKRRNDDTLHVIYENAIQYNMLSIEDKRHIGMSFAMLFGDYFHMLSSTLFGKIGMRLEASIQDLYNTTYHNYMKNVLYGQLEDVLFQCGYVPTETEIINKSYRKTADYSFIKPLEMGCIVSHNTDYMPIMNAFGGALGIAFQLQDDMLDVFGELDNIGKMPLGDYRDGVHTLYSSYLLTHKNSVYRDMYSAHFGDNSYYNNDELRQLLIDSGAYEYSNQLIKRYFDDAHSVLDNHKNTLPDYVLERLYAIVDTICKRHR